MHMQCGHTPGSVERFFPRTRTLTTQNAPGRAPQHAADTTRGGATHTQKVDKNNDQQSASCLERLAQTHNLFLVLSDVLRQEALHFGELLLRRHRPSLELRALAL